MRRKINTIKLTQNTGVKISTEGQKNGHDNCVQHVTNLRGDMKDTQKTQINLLQIKPIVIEMENTLNGIKID